MVSAENEYSYLVASENELNDLLAGRNVGLSFKWPPTYAQPNPVPPGSTGVIWKEGDLPGDPIRPLALVANEDDLRRLFGRFSQLRSDFSPLTSWCYILTSQQFDSLRSVHRQPTLAGFEAAWAGLVIAEAQLLSDRPLGSLRFPGCLATQSFAIARAEALWAKLSQSEISNRFNTANKLIRNGNATQHQQFEHERIRAALQPIWSSLSCLSRQNPRSVEPDLRFITDSLFRLQEAKHNKDSNEITSFIKPLFSSVPEARTFMQVPVLAPEQRLRVFDDLVHNLRALPLKETSARRNGLALLAGYLATIAAGGVPSLSLAENNSRHFPEILAWAYVVGGIGERVIWTSSFDGLGRLVARELMRPFRIDEPPYCDFALDEANVLIDPKLSDPLVHLKIKQAQSVTIALMPGVNISVPLAPAALADIRHQPSQGSRQVETIRRNKDPLSILADALWPYFQAQIEEYISSEGGQKTSRSKPRGSSPKLPLSDSKK